MIVLLLAAATAMPPVTFESRDGGTQVLMGKDLIVEFRQNRYLRFRATNRNDLWVGSEKKPMDLCWAYADPGINDFVFRTVQTRRTAGGFEVNIEGDKPSLEGRVKIGLAARWLPERGEFEYVLTGNLDFKPAKFYARSKVGPNAKGPATIEATDWHIEHISLPDRLGSRNPASPEVYDWFVYSDDQVNWMKSPKVHIVYVTRPGSYPTIHTATGMKRGGAFGWVDREQGGWLVYPESETPGQKHSFTLCWMFFDVHFHLPDAVPARGRSENAALSYALRFAPVDAAASRAIVQKAREVEWRGRREYELPVMKMGNNDFKDLVTSGDGQYMWWASSYECYRDDRVGFDDKYSVSIKSESEAPKAWYAACFGRSFQREPITGSFRVRAKVKTEDCDGWVGIGATDRPEAWPYSRSWPKDPAAVAWVRSKPLTGTNGWREVVLDVIVKPGPYKRWTIALEHHGKGQSWWDNVVVEKIGSK